MNSTTHPSLDAILEINVENASIARQTLGPLWPAASDITQLLVSLVDLLLKAGARDPHEGHEAAARALLFARRASCHALLNVVRFQLIEAAGEHRRMLEWTALAWQFLSRPEIVRVWVTAHKGGLDDPGDKHHKDYKRRFNPQVVQEHLTDLDPGLARMYHELNPFVHGTLVSQVQSLRLIVDVEPPLLVMSYIDVEKGSAKPLVAQVLGVLHSIVLAVDSIAQRALDPESHEAWESLSAAARSRIESHRRLWKAAFARSGV